jgi:hypothetical protein
MDSIELYRQLLGVTTPWAVECVEMEVPHLRVDVYLATRAELDSPAPSAASN